MAPKGVWSAAIYRRYHESNCRRARRLATGTPTQLMKAIARSFEGGSKLPGCGQ
jgi:hypothetical protein